MSRLGFCFGANHSSSRRQVLHSQNSSVSSLFLSPGRRTPLEQAALCRASLRTRLHLNYGPVPTTSLLPVCASKTMEALLTVFGGWLAGGPKTRKAPCRAT
jgi:hypothetical protein